MFSKLAEGFRNSGLYRNYAARDASERQIILGLIVAVAVLLLWAAVWKPVADWSATAQQQHQRKQTLLDWMQANEKQARELGGSGGGQAASPDGLLTVVSRTAKESGLNLVRYQPESSGGVSVVLQKEPFNDVIKWLDGLQNQHQVMVVQASVDADALGGRVNARFSLRR